MNNDRCQALIDAAKANCYYCNNATEYGPARGREWLAEWSHEHIVTGSSGIYLPCTSSGIWRMILKEDAKNGEK